MPLTSVFPSPVGWDLVQFPPEWNPATLPPPVQPTSILYPFNIPPKLYNEMLDVKWPLSIAIIYATTVSTLNRINKARGNKPWAVSRTGTFTLFVLAHNIFLTVYSAWTFVGMLRGMIAVFGGINREYPMEKYGFAAIVDGLCKMNGPRGLGNAVIWDPETSRWSVSSLAVRLLSGKPDYADVGRLWNEGLGFYGWIFYLSKFYEVLDTVIILAKGKRSSLLQTYHHAGAMLCMWAGIRFMSPPIWMFVQFNSGIHALMYFYYTLAALGVRVPNAIKRTLTSMQISQFVIGASFAISHLFIAYQVPVNTPYIFRAAASSVSSAAPAITSAAAAGISSWLKKGALRAAGFEGLAENVKDESGHRFGFDALKAQLAEDSRNELRYRMEYPAVHCLDTSGQTFAIWLNCVYLAPLTYLFARFFYISYIKRAAAATKVKQRPAALSARMVRSGSDAAKGVDREIRHAMGDAQGYNSPIDDEFAVELQDEIDQVSTRIVNGARKVKNGARETASQVTETVKSTINGVTSSTTTTTTTTWEEATVIDEDGKITKSGTVRRAKPKDQDDAHVKAGESYADAVKTESTKQSTPPPGDEDPAASPSSSSLFG